MTSQANFQNVLDNGHVRFALRLGFDTVSSIATRMGMSKATVKRTLSRLESDKVVWFDYGANSWKLEA